MLDNNSRYVYEVYKLKSVSLAAKKLYISQPALSSAIKKAEAGDTVLLSPAFTSYDSFKNFVERGDRFKEIIKNYYRGC